MHEKKRTHSLHRHLQAVQAVITAGHIYGYQEKVKGHSFTRINPMTGAPSVEIHQKCELHFIHKSDKTVVI